MHHSSSQEEYIKELEEKLKSKDRKIDVLKTQLKERRVEGSKILNEIRRMNQNIVSKKIEFAEIVEKVKNFNNEFVVHHEDALKTIDLVYMLNQDLLLENADLKDQKVKLLEANDKLKKIAKIWEENFEKNNEATNTLFETEQKLREKSQRLEAAYAKTYQKITESINYAKKLQEAMMPDSLPVQHNLSDTFIFWQPKDIVSGDFYWMCEKNYKIIVAAVDCTGHGVPGAIMSAVGIRLLNEIVFVKGILEPADILYELDKNVNNMLVHSKEKRREGMDAAICVIDNIPEYYREYVDEKKIKYAGARQPFVYIKDGELNRVRGDKKSIGEKSQLIDNEDFKYTQHEVLVDSPVSFYLFSDGFQDQFGGLGKKFSLRRMEEIFLANYKKTMEEQKDIITNEFIIWKGDEQQIDDVTVMGFKVV
ncbi:MAG: hypothetical protein CMO01_16530 [Thalassobius sp.]|nr:hypothetical protein [Thalassovita sp.]